MVAKIGASPVKEWGTASETPGNALAKLCRRIEALFHAIIDFLILVWYTLEHFLYEIERPGPHLSEEIFGKDNIVCFTKNFAPLSDLRSYVELRRNPEAITESMRKIEREYGVISPLEYIQPKPHMNGFCLGDVAVFLRTWLTSRDIGAINRQFEDGSPLEGAKIQTYYQSLELDRTTPYTAPRTYEENGDAAFKYAGLSVEKGRLIDETAQVLFQSLAQASTGTYAITTPTYTPSGELKGYHALGLVIEHHVCYILDPNLAIGKSTKQDLASTLGRIFTQYVGLDYSTSLAGKRPSRLAQACNWLNERANPPAGPNEVPLFTLTPVSLLNPS